MLALTQQDFNQFVYHKNYLAVLGTAACQAQPKILLKIRT